MKNNNMVTVEIDLDDDVLLKLALEAHRRNLTLNDLCIEILQNYVDGKLKIETDEQRETRELEEKMAKASCNIVLNGVTQETLSEFGQVFTEWNLSYLGEKTCRELIQRGFDDADIIDP